MARSRIPVTRHAVLCAILLALVTSPLALALAQSRRPPQTTPLSAADAATLQHALDAYDAGHPETAQPTLETLARQYPQNFEISEALGGLYAEAGDLARALPLLEHAARLAPAQAIAHANLGSTYLKLDRTAEAIRELNRAAALDPHNGQTQSSLGQALLSGKQPKAAAAAFTAAAATDPGDPDIQYNLALALFEAGSLKPALDAIHRIPEPRQTDQAHSLAADIEEKLGDYKAAVLDDQAAARINPSEPNVYLLGIEMLRHWTFGPATEVFNFGVGRFPDSTRLRLGLGIAHYGNSDFKGAIPIFLNLLEQHPDDEHVADLLGRSCSAVGAGEAAGCDGLTDFALRHPGNAAAGVFAATSILHQPQAAQDTGQAEHLLRTAIAADPRIPDAYYQLATIEQSREQWKDSIADLEKAISLRPTYAEAHYRLSRAYAHIGDREKAQQQIALQQQYSQQEKDRLNQHLHEVVTFLSTPN